MQVMHSLPYSLAWTQNGSLHLTCCMVPALVAGLHEMFALQTSETTAGNHFLVTRDTPLSGTSAGPAATGSSEQEGHGRVRVLRAGPEITAVLDAMHTHTQRLRVLIEGTVHPCGDFVVRLGQLYLNNTLTGAVVDVEYLPCALASQASAAPLHAFLDLLVPPAERDFCSGDVECFRGAQQLPEAFGYEHGTLMVVALMRTKLLSTDAARGKGQQAPAAHSTVVPNGLKRGRAGE